eukprot:TRINITY_DN3308_c0_g1_i1.p1 TRINITY_DN3308_c0_g1~~TRINITY_DN3308_c0_g1_i1.p1  ORF type:complete len:1007 (-),score=291.58 TRINITY_DN3308_c0_g1_i1:183-3203(-)
MDDKNKHICKSSENNASDNSSIEGSAARTRPYSIEDIILKRYSKKLMNDVKEANKKVKSELVKPVETILDKSKDNDGSKTELDFADDGIKSSIRWEQKSFSGDQESVKKAEKVSRGLSISSTIHIPKESQNSESYLDGAKINHNELKKEKKEHSHRGVDDEDRYRSYRRETTKDKDKHRGDSEKQKDGKLGRMLERGDQRKSEENDDKIKRKEIKRKHEGNIKEEKNSYEMDKVSKRRNEGKTLVSEKFEKAEIGEYKERKNRHDDTHHSSRYKEGRSRHGKRSPSSDYKRSRERGRSPSPALRSSKRHSSNHGKDHVRDQSTYQLSAERSDRLRDDLERNAKEKGGNFVPHSGSSRRYSGSSGLGGYSPRRRRSETAVRTPSPPNRSPERKPAWDLTPGGLDSNMVAAMVAAYQASTHQMSLSLTAAATNVVSSSENIQRPSAPSPSVGQPTSHPANSFVETVELTQSSRPSRRLHITNLPSSVSDKEVTDFFNSAMSSTNFNHLPGARPCISCVVNLEKNQAFAEFLTPEDATAAITLDGTSFRGNSLQIKRPKDFSEPANGSVEKRLPVADTVLDVVKDSPNKIFIGGIPRMLGSDKIKDIVSAFGQLKAFHMEINKNEKSPDIIAFLEYVDPLITLKACAGLNGMKLGGHVLTVVQATPDASLDCDNTPFYGVPDHAIPLMQQPTRVLELRNVLSKEDLQQMSDAELEEILEDVRLECMRFGTVKSVNISRGNADGGGLAVPTVGENMELETMASEATEGCNFKNPSGEVSDIKDLSGSLENHNTISCQSVPENVEDSTIHSKVDADNNDKSLCNVTADKCPPGPANTANPDLNNNVDSLSEAKQEQIKSEAPSNDIAASHEGNQEPQTTDASTKHSESDGKCDQDLKPQQELELQDSLIGNSRANGSSESQNGSSENQKQTSNTPENICLGSDQIIMHDNMNSRNCHQLEEASILVEFSREEGACLAAHNLHGRLFGFRNVSVNYLPESTYFKEFPRTGIR